MRPPGEIMFVEVQRLIIRSDEDSSPIPWHFVNAVDGQLHVVFGVWDGGDHADALIAAAEFGLPVFDVTGRARS